MDGLKNFNAFPLCASNLDGLHSPNSLVTGAGVVGSNDAVQRVEGLMVMCVRLGADKCEDVPLANAVDGGDGL